MFAREASGREGGALTQCFAESLEVFGFPARWSFRRAALNTELRLWRFQLGSSILAVRYQSWLK
jgi:hypothetical protein